MAHVLYHTISRHWLLMASGGRHTHTRILIHKPKQFQEIRPCSPGLKSKKLKLNNIYNYAKIGIKSVVDLLENVFHLCMHGCTYPAGIMFA